ncbi:MAG: hypothetical protein Q3X95_08345 [Duodenibacillus sp.]|nr:hypothetical protein [Duodenibacillus sp.]
MHGENRVVAGGGRRKRRLARNIAHGVPQTLENRREKAAFGKRKIATKLRLFPKKTGKSGKFPVLSYFAIFAGI